MHSASTIRADSALDSRQRGIFLVSHLLGWPRTKRGRHLGTGELWDGDGGWLSQMCHTKSIVNISFHQHTLHIHLHLHTFGLGLGVAGSRRAGTAGGVWRGEGAAGGSMSIYVSCLHTVTVVPAIIL